MKAAPYIDTPLTKPSRTSIRRQLKKDRQKDISRMDTFSVLIFLYRRHEIVILYASVGLLFVYLIVSKVGL